MKKIIFCFIVLMFFIITPWGYAQESMTLTTFYPSPIGVYNTLMLTPRGDPGCINPDDWGKMYFDSASNSLLFCTDDGTATGAQWDTIGGASGEDIWDRDGATEEVFLKELNDFVGIGTENPKFKLSLAGDGGIIAEGAEGSGADLGDLGGGTRLIWYPKKAAFRVGETFGDNWDEANIGLYSTVSGGGGSIASAQGSTVSGGASHIASGINSTVGGGTGNTASGESSVVAGGAGNTATHEGAVVSGGNVNRATNEFTVIGGGWGNVADGLNSTVGGGQRNTVSGNFATISGGYTNTANGYCSYVGGGGGCVGGDPCVPEGNIANGVYSTIAGGRKNQTDGADSTIGGGNNNLVGANFATISGGQDNTASAVAAYSVISGGSANHAQDRHVVIGGGGANTVSASFSTISGGQSNTVSGGHSVVAGGAANRATGPENTIGGGVNNSASSGASTVTGGFNNMAGSAYSTVSGGLYNTARGTASWVGGLNMKLSGTSHRTFVWGYSSAGFNVNSATTDAFLIFPNGSTNPPRVGILTDTPTETLHVAGTVRVGSLPPGTASICASATGVLGLCSSSSKYKKDIRDLDVSLEDVLQLEPVKFAWKKTGQEDIGLIAEDVDEIVPDLVIYDQEGQPNGVKYNKVALYLLEVLKELNAESEELEQRLRALEEL